MLQSWQYYLWNWWTNRSQSLSLSIYVLYNINERCQISEYVLSARWRNSQILDNVIFCLMEDLILHCSEKCSKNVHFNETIYISYSPQRKIIVLVWKLNSKLNISIWYGICTYSFWPNVDSKIHKKKMFGSSLRNLLQPYKYKIMIYMSI